MHTIPRNPGNTPGFPISVPGHKKLFPKDAPKYRGAKNCSPKSPRNTGAKKNYSPKLSRNSGGKWDQSQSFGTGEFVPENKSQNFGSGNLPPGTSLKVSGRYFGVPGAKFPGKGFSGRAPGPTPFPGFHSLVVTHPLKGKRVMANEASPKVHRNFLPINKLYLVPFSKTFAGCAGLL